jgi:hypothetical protein
MNHPPKAVSVTEQGQPDGFVPPMAYKVQILDGGYTRLCISTPPGRLKIVHRALVSALQPPLKFLYVRMTDRLKGQLPTPEHYVGVELSPERILDALDRFSALVYHDGRNQIWVRSALNEQIVLEEIGALYAYPDDPLFRDTVEKFGLVEAQHDSMDARDYIKVNFLSEVDAEEKALMAELGLVRWQG